MKKLSSRHSVIIVFCHLVSVLALGVENDYVERPLQVLVVSADATKIDQVRVETYHPSAIFYYAKEIGPRRDGEMCANGFFSLVNESDQDPAIPVNFRTTKGLHELTLDAVQFVDHLNSFKLASEGTFGFTQDGSAFLSSLPLLKESAENRIDLTAIYSVPMDQPLPATDSLKAAIQSRLTYVGSPTAVEAKLAELKRGMKQAGEKRVTPEAWQVGRQLFREHFSMGALRVRITERRRKGAEESVDLGNLAVVSHNKLAGGHIVLPQVGEGGAGAEASIVPLMAVKKGVGAVTEFRVKSEAFLASFVRSAVGNVAMDSVLQCDQTAQVEGGSLCVPSGDGSDMIQMTLPVDRQGNATAPLKGKFYLVEKQGDLAKRRWRIDLEFASQLPPVGDVEMEPVTSGVELP